MAFRSPRFGEVTRLRLLVVSFFKVNFTKENLIGILGYCTFSAIAHFVLGATVWLTVLAGVFGYILFAVCYELQQLRKRRKNDDME